MKSNTYDLFKYADYYIWWFLNCSQSVSKEQIQKDADGIIDQLKRVYLQTGVFSPELEVLSEIQLLGYDIHFYRSIKEMEKWLDEDFQKQCDAEIDKYYDDYYSNYWREQFA